MVGKELPHRTTAAEDHLLAIEVGLYRLGETCEVQCEQRALPVALITPKDVSSMDVTAFRVQSVSTRIRSPGMVYGW